MSEQTPDPETQATGNAAEQALRLYVFDCGVIDTVTSEEFGFEAGTLPSSMTTPCYLIVHPRGVLLWDTGEIPDAEFDNDGELTRKRTFSASRKLGELLAEVGYGPHNIDFLAFSHYHNDHVANANMFAGQTWLVQRAERDAMFDPNPDFERFGPVTPDQQYFDQLKDARTVIIENCDHDVFGDGSVVIKFSPGHTAGHQSLFVDLHDTGPLLITGDVYHYYDEINRPADFVNHVSNAVTTESRRKLEAFADETGADMWIPHDIRRAASFRKAPAFYC